MFKRIFLPYVIWYKGHIMPHDVFRDITASVSPRTQRMNSGLESLPLFTGLQNAFLTGLGQLVKVYVRLNHESPRILCVTNRLRVSELIDPIFQWHGPNENSSMKITPTGTLIFRHFKYDLSGVYTCSIVYKPTAEQSEKNYLIKYVIYGKMSEQISAFLCCKCSFFFCF
uniref:Ig-like domain-containing protein n=1 Tax=Crocodylus porosus TaxID=8502 RepID=A0A7M4G0Q1_CROPO